MVSFRQRRALGLRPRLKRLHEVQEEIYRQLQLLLPRDVALHEHFRSEVRGSPRLRLDVLERHPYTHFLRLTYWFPQGPKPTVAPDAHFRVYHDARMAEVTAFDPAQGFTRSAHPWYPARPLLQKLWRQNLAMDKWLTYLIGQGHSVETMRPASRSIDAGEAAGTPVTVGG